MDGISFKNSRQANKWTELKALERAGEITFLRHNPRYKLIADITYSPTFSYRQNNQLVLMDMDPPTDVYRLKKRLVRHLLSVEIVESY